MKNGFTLVELSIVLIIIGLLVGGILVGQSLIDSAKINSFVREIQQYDIAVSQFQSKFRKMPGDANRDGKIRDATNNDANFDGEISNFWKELSDYGILKETYTNVVTTGIIAGTNIPSIVFDKKVGLLAGTNYDGQPGFGTPYPLETNAYVTFGNSVAGIAISGNDSQSEIIAPLKPATVLSIDTKMDNGVANTGTIVAVRARHMGWQAWSTGDSLIPGNDNYGCVTTFRGPRYDASHDTKICAVAIKMQVGY